MEWDYKKLRDDAGLTLEDVERLSGYAKSTINGLEKHGNGSARLRAKLESILTAERSRKALTECVMLNAVITEPPIIAPLQVTANESLILRYCNAEQLRELMKNIAAGLHGDKVGERVRRMEALNVIGAELDRRVEGV